MEKKSTKEPSKKQKITELGRNEILSISEPRIVGSGLNFISPNEAGVRDSTRAGPPGPVAPLNGAFLCF